MMWYVAVGGAVGSLSRYLVGITIQSRGGIGFPIATLVINLTGSLLLGFLARYSFETSVITPEMRSLLTAGFCGGYTTFSTFSYETVALIEDGDWRRAALYVILSVVGSLIGVVLGMAGARQLIGIRH